MTDWLQQARKGCPRGCCPETGIAPPEEVPGGKLECRLEAEHQRTATKMQDEAERCIAIVERLLQDARQELGQLKIATRPDVFAGWTQGLKKAVEALRR